MGFGTFIREKREQAGVPMNEFARSLGISPAYWSRIERELEKAPKDELITKAAEALGLNPDEAFIEASRLPPICRRMSAPSFVCIANPWVKAVTDASAFPAV